MYSFVPNGNLPCPSGHLGSIVARSLPSMSLSHLVLACNNRDKVFVFVSKDYRLVQLLRLEHLICS